MTLIEFSEWLSQTPLSQLIQTTSWAIPGLQTVHILALAVLFASAMVVALRVFGLGLRAESIAAAAQRFTPPVWKALAVLAVTGALLISAEPGRTLGNPMFNLKMVCLVAAIVVTVLLRGQLREGRSVGALQNLLAVASIGLWATIIFAGRLIAYTEAY